MTNRFSGQRGILILFWVLACVTIPIWMHTDPPAWDLHVYENAAHALQKGHDPYADGIAAQKIFYAQRALHPDSMPPYAYVYSPITLLLLRAIGRVPVRLSEGLYWMLYIAGVLAQIWVGMQAAKPAEWRFFVFLAPAAAFFPGLLVQDNMLGGNVAYILYGLILVAALAGWRRGQWHWFYLATLAASCFKAPLLSLLPIPILSTRRQWLPAGLTGVLGLALFAIQPLLWPSLFRHYLEAVELLSYNSRDFGLSPAGLFAHALTRMGLPYSPWSTLFYLLYVIPVFGVLLYLSKQFLRGRFTLAQWMPVMLVGVILLNPRIMIYDVVPLTIPMALILWRFFVSFTTPAKAAIFTAVLLAVADAFILAYSSIDLWEVMDGLLLIAVFAAGCRSLFRLAVQANLYEPAPV
jgi:hypothetical protein